MQGKSLRSLALASAAALVAAFALVFAYAPLDADQGPIQKIFYLHVPLAIVALCGFMAGGIMAVRHLRTGDRRWDVRSYVSIHLSIVFGVAVLVTGSIWAKASWGHWWVWDEPTLVSFLIVFLLYCTYQPLRFAIEDPERQARYASVFAVTAGAFVPLNFIAVRMAEAYTHPASPVGDGRTDAGRDATHVHRRADRHRAPVHDAVETGARREGGGRPTASPAPSSSPRTARRRLERGSRTVLPALTWLLSPSTAPSSTSQQPTSCSSRWSWSTPSSSRRGSRARATRPRPYQGCVREDDSR